MTASRPLPSPSPTDPAEPPRAFTRVDAWSLALLGLFTALALAGFGTFGRHPELLARFPSSRGFYAAAFEVFARGHVILAFLVLGLILTRRVGWRWLPALAVAGAISLAMELLGTATGFPFSGYRYTELLGWRVAGLVPLLIPFSWFMMGFPAFVLARALTGAEPRGDSTRRERVMARARTGAEPPGGSTRRPASCWPIDPGRPTRRRIRAIVAGALLLTAWDLTLDPAMSDLAPYWVWEADGLYYGMPLVNLLGWFGTGLLIMAGFAWVGADRVADRIPPTLMEAYFATVVALSLAMTLIAGYWLAVALTLAILALVRWGGFRWVAP